MDNIWSSKHFAKYLQANYKKKFEGKSVYEDIIKPQITKQIIASLQSVQDNVENRENSFGLYGYDFMVDANLKVWMIEVNSGPSMEYKDQPILEKLVSGVQEDMVSVILKEQNTGKFRLIHKQKAVKRLTGSVGLDLKVYGKNGLAPKQKSIKKIKSIK